MGKILLLDELTSSKIAAGEVVERPASVVREMVDNAVDAGATRVNIEIKNGGIKYIRIEDNGVGFEPDDVVIAFDKHATSKIVTADDIENVKTLGFRGEALASIAAVSKVSLKTKTEEAESGVYVVFQGGELLENGACGCKKGSAFLVENLFYNTPARYKFLKKDQTEGAYVCDVVEKAALAHPEVSFTLISDKKQVLHTPGNGDMLSAIYGIFGKDFTQFLKPVSFKLGGVSVSGFAGKRELTYGNRNRQLTFVNGRFIKNKTIQTAIDESYKTLVMRGKFPCVFLDISISPSMVDVNVSPAKTEVRFSDDGLVFKAVYNAIYSVIFDLEERFGDFKEKDESLNHKKAGTYLGDAKESPIITTTKDFQGGLPEKTSEKLSEKPDSGLMEKQAVKPSEKTTNDKSDVSEAEAIVLPFTEENVPVTEPKIITAESKEPEIEVFPLEVSEKTKSNLYEDVYKNARVIGQLFETYILLEYGNSFYMLDQHAAHERLMYERIKEALTVRENDSQLLLVPVTVTLSPSEFQKFRSSKETLEGLGFELDEFGLNTVIIRSAPLILGDVDPENFVVGAIREFDDKSANGTNVFSDNAVYTMACKAAIKANKKLSEDEISALLRDLAGIPDLDTCPHGRPIIIRMSKYEIERKFHRA